MVRFPRLFLAGLIALLAPAPAHAVDLFAFRDASSGRVLAFALPDTEPIQARVDRAAVTQGAVDWARRFYRLNDLDALAVEFQTRPTRCWRLTFLARGNGQMVYLYLHAVVLPDGRVVEPTVREET